MLCSFVAVATHPRTLLHVEEVLNKAGLFGVCFIGTLHYLLLMKPLEELIDELRRVLRSVAIQWLTIHAFEKSSTSLEEHQGIH